MDRSGKSAARRGTLTAGIAAILLQDGVAVLPLRNLAARLETSDRMLLYYFGNQSELVGAALRHLSEGLAVRLTHAIPPLRLPPQALLKKLLVAMADPGIAPVLRVWGDVTARGARGEQPFREFAALSVAMWQAWIAARLDVRDRVRRDNAAMAILVMVEGLRMLELSAPGSTRGAALLLARAFD